MQEWNYWFINSISMYSKNRPAFSANLSSIQSNPLRILNHTEDSKNYQRNEFNEEILQNRIRFAQFKQITNKLTKNKRNFIISFERELQEYWIILILFS